MASENTMAFLSSLDSLSETELFSKSLWEKVKELIESAFVPQIAICTERPSEVSDFAAYLDNVKDKFKGLQVLLEKLVNVNEDSKKNFKKQFGISLLIICGEHSAVNNWTTEDTIESSLNIMDLLCHIYNYENVTKLLVGNDNNGLFGSALLALRPKLLGHTWKTYPSAVVCFYWMLTKVKSPHLSDHLNYVLVPAIILVDDFVQENTILGIQCLKHVLRNVTITELQWNGQGEIIYTVLEPLMHRREPKLLPHVASALALFLTDHVQNEENVDWSHHDDILEILLQNMDMEQESELRKAYLECLYLLVNAANLRASRWSNALLRILKEYMEVCGHYHLYEEADLCLTALYVWLVNCWPAMLKHTELVLQLLLKLVYDFSTEDPDPTKTPSLDNILGYAEICLRIVVRLGANEVQILCKDIKQKLSFNSVMSSLVERTFNDID